jgi:hypothetical protein
MPTIPDQQGQGSWDDVTLLTRQDPVDAGENGEGIANDQAKQLVARTRWLRDLAEQMGVSLDDLTTAFNDHTAAADPHNQYVLKTTYDAQVANLQATIEELKTGAVWQEKAADFNVELLQDAIARYRVDSTTGPVAGLLPEAMTDGQSAIFVDQTDTWDANPLYLVVPESATYTLEGAEPYTGTETAPLAFADSGLDYGANGVAVTLSGDALTASIDLGSSGAAETEVSGARLLTLSEYYTGKRWVYVTLTNNGDTTPETAFGDRGPSTAGTFGVMLTSAGLTDLSSGNVIDADFVSGESLLLEFDFSVASLRIVTDTVDVTATDQAFAGKALDAWLQLSDSAANSEVASVAITTDPLALPAWAVPANDATPLETVNTVALQAAQLTQRGAIAHLVYDASDNHVSLAITAESSPLSEYVVIDSNTVLGAEHSGKTLYVTADADITMPPLADWPRGYEFQITPSAKDAHTINLVTSGADPVRNNETVILGDVSVSRSPDGAQWLTIGEAMGAV